MDAPTPPPDVVTLADPCIGGDERAAVDRVMRSGWISMGHETAAFEAEFAAALGAPGAVATSSGTAALHLAMLALGVGPDDEVIVPSLTFVASAAAAVMAGARPVFVDVVGPDDLTVDPAAVAKAIGPRTAAIVAVHYGGWAAKCHELRRLAEDAGVRLVEDAAHAPPTGTTDGAVGTVGDAGCFSFHATKNMTTAEGGMVTARDPAVLDRVRALRSHGMTTVSWHPEQGRGNRYDIPELGFNYRPTDLASAIGRVQLARLRQQDATRQVLAAEYRRCLASRPVAVPFPARAPAAHHLLPVLLPSGVNRDRLQGRLRGAGIQTGVHYPPIHRFSAYRGFGRGPSGLERTESLAPRLLSLPLHGRMTVSDVGRVVAALGQALAAQGVDCGRPTSAVSSGVSNGN